MVESCYIHVPFCDSICAYCDFTRMVMNDSVFQNWKKQLLREMDAYSIENLKTLYFGGGTPSLLEGKDFMEICQHLPENIEEFTVECNPESVSISKLMAYTKCGVNRISLGVQSFNDDLLKICNRKHTARQAIETIERIRNQGITNISIDLIFGLPYQTLDDVKKDLKQFIELDLPHLSIYSLQIEENSVFGKQQIQPCDADLEADMFEYIERFMKEHGYIHYEISSFCKPGYTSKHNLAYWQDQDFYGIGCGASGRIDGIRYDNTKSLKQYCQGQAQVQWIEESLLERSMDAIMMALRTCYGLNINEWNTRYHLDFERKYHTVLEQYKDFFKRNGNTISLNEKGFEILNTILVDFMMIE